MRRWPGKVGGGQCGHDVEDANRSKLLSKQGESHPIHRASNSVTRGGYTAARLFVAEETVMETRHSRYAHTHNPSNDRQGPHQETKPHSTTAMPATQVSIA